MITSILCFNNDEIVGLTPSAADSSASLRGNSAAGSSEARDPKDESRLSAVALAKAGKTNIGMPDIRYADIAIDEMLKRIEAEGAKKECIVAKLIGAANMFSAVISKIGEENISYAREKLKHVSVPIAGECIGGSQGRSVEFSIATGIVTVKTKF